MKKRLIRKHLLKYPMASDRKIAELLGCKPKEVNVVRRDMLDSGEIPQIDAEDDKEDAMSNNAKCDVKHGDHGDRVSTGITPIGVLIYAKR